MNSIYNATDYQAILGRIEKLSPKSERIWGKMSVSQMLAHCSQGIKMALGDLKPKRSFIGFLIGRFYKGMLTGEIRMPKNSPTSPLFLITDEREFEKEKQNLLILIKRMHQGGEASATTHPNPFFGKISPQEWGSGQYVHLDHHLRQFGV